MSDRQLDLFSRRSKGKRRDDDRRIKGDAIARHELAKMRAILGKKKERAMLACI